MNILILSSANPYINSGIVALNLYNNLRKEKKNNVKILTINSIFDDNKDVISVVNNLEYSIKYNVRRYKNHLHRLIKPNQYNRKTKYSFKDYRHSGTVYSTSLLLKKIPFNPDAIIVTNMEYFVTYQNLYELNQKTGAPIYLFMMDMAPMTGGCHYSWGCKKYENKCGKCPALNSEKENDQSRKNWLFNKQMISQTNITVIAGGKYHYDQLKRSSLFKNKKRYKILTGIDEILFKPGNRESARDKFKLPQSKKLLLFAATNALNERKGFTELFEALTILKKKMSDNYAKDIHLVIAGRKSDEIGKMLPFDSTCIGYLSHQELATAFQAVDVFLNPSIQDSGPMMVNQSIISGTPVISFIMGIAEDLVINYETGFKVKLGDTGAFANAIMEYLKLKEHEINKIEVNCRNLGLEKTSSRAQLNSIFELLEK